MVVSKRKLICMQAFSYFQHALLKFSWSIKGHILSFLWMAIKTKQLPVVDFGSHNERINNILPLRIR